MNYKEYSPDWKDIIRPQILQRDGYKCQSCGINHKIRVYKNSRKDYVECDDFIEEWAKKNGKKVFTLYLAVAHLDHDKSNNDPSNLLTLCPKCHSKYDAAYKRSMRNIILNRTAQPKSFRELTLELSALILSYDINSLNDEGKTKAFIRKIKKKAAYLQNYKAGKSTK